MNKLICIKVGDEEYIRPHPRAFSKWPFQYTATPYNWRTREKAEQAIFLWKKTLHGIRERSKREGEYAKERLPKLRSRAHRATTKYQKNRIKPWYEVEENMPKIKERFEQYTAEYEQARATAEWELMSEYTKYQHHEDVEHEIVELTYKQYHQIAGI